ncbi:MAG TPA: protein kinase, partial [Candidatus Udaeobacter sp.]|nr:protein kinase [Candidatus Udaeobacter sp.]
NVKVLDFGLAKGGGSGNPSDPALSASPTMTYAATTAGVILGTAAYMSPEQARGKAVDKRTDIWSFGCLVYECLTGRQVFEGETVSDLIARILEREPDLSALPPQTPGRVRDLLRRCLEKDARRRMRDMGDARIELEEAIAVRQSASSRRVAGAAAASPVVRMRHLAIGALAGIAVATLGLLILHVIRHQAAMPVTRFAITAPKDFKFGPDASFSSISPDGRQLAIIVRDTTGKFLMGIRPLESLSLRLLPGTENAQGGLCWSPDSRAIAFFADGKLKKVSIDGGAAEVLCNANNGRGAAWSPKGVIVFAPAGGGPLFKVPDSGGDPEQVTTLDSTKKETGHRFPSFLPDGRHFLFAALSSQPKREICVASIDSHERKTVMTSEAGAIYAEPGYLVCTRNNILVAQRFDARGLRLIGQPQTLGEVPSGSQFLGAAHATVSSNGILSFAPLGFANTRLDWTDPMGKDLGPTGIPPDQYVTAELSPDGRRAAMMRFVSGTETDIWLADLERRAVTRFTYGPAVSEEPRWSPDGSRIIFRSNRNGPYDFFIKPSNGSGQEELFYHSNVMFKEPDSWSDDGAYIVMSQLDPETGWDLWVIPTQGDHTARPYLRTRFTERSGTISPDGHWMCYTSDESGPVELYVQSFPTPGNKVQITNGGGGSGGWSRDGKKFYYPMKDQYMVADVLPGPEFRLGPPRLFGKQDDKAVYGTADRSLTKFAALMPVEDAQPGSITVILNWTAALKKL